MSNVAVRNTFLLEKLNKKLTPNNYFELIGVEYYDTYLYVP